MSVSPNGAKITRRTLAAALGPAAMASLIEAQKPAPAADSPAEELRIARERIRNNADALAKVKLPMATEPAFQFKA
jgi:hypothetical protein